MDIKEIVSNMTLEEKEGMCSGRDFWTTKAVERLGVLPVMMTDGPHGLRKQKEASDHLGLHDSVEAICFPAGSALASSFDRSLIQHIGELLGEEASTEDVHTLLGPAINIKRSPLCGRNFEYLSEDPFLAGEMSASYVKGVQKANVGVSVKHYAANNQEYRRMSVNTIVDERTLREIYLKAFEITVKKSSPWAVMCAYNRVNGTYCCENEFLLTETLRNEWGFDGIVMTDWGAMNNRVKAVKAGLNLEMPSSNGINDSKIVKAVNNGELPIEVLDNAVADLLTWIFKGVKKETAKHTYSKAIHHEESRKAAEQCAVLLKNDGGVLPLSKKSNTVFIGPYAKKPRYQGGGSSHINPTKVENAVEAAKNLPVTFYAGVSEDGITRSEELLEAAVHAAKEADAAVLFVGLPDSFESEGYDRIHLDIPDCQKELIEKVASVQLNTVVVLHNGSSVVMPWIDKVPAILEMYLGGQGIGGATVNLLYGDANPCGKLAETFPVRLEDTPSYLQFPNDGKTVTYGESIFVGYRWYDSRKMDVLFPFGHGLSYTTFEISGLTLSKETLSDDETLDVSVNVKNTGCCDGSEVVQIYIVPPEKQLLFRPAKELKGFEKVVLRAGEEKRITISIDKSAFTYYNTEIKDWFAPTGVYTILAGSSSRNILEEAKINIISKWPRLIYSETTVVGDLMERNMTKALDILMKQSSIFGRKASSETAAPSGAISMELIKAMMEGMPVRSIASNMSEQEIQEVFDLEV